MKLTEAWAIKHWRKGLYPDTIRRTRAETIQSFKDNFEGAADEKDFGKYAPNKAVKVIVLEDTPSVRSTVGMALIALEGREK